MATLEELDRIIAEKRLSSAMDEKKTSNKEEAMPWNKEYWTESQPASTGTVFDENNLARRLPSAAGNAVKSILAGLGEGAQDVYKTLPGPLKNLMGAQLGNYGEQASNLDVNELLGRENPNIGNQFLQGASKLAPWIMAGGPRALGQVAAGGAQGFTEQHPGLLSRIAGQESGLGMKLANTLEGALQLPSFVKGVNITSNPKASLQGVKEKALDLAVGKERLPIEEIERRSALAGEAPISFGEIAQSPRLKHLTEAVNKLPFSGNKALEEQVEKESEKIAGTALEKITGGKEKTALKEDVEKLLPEEYKNISEKAAQEYSVPLDLSDMVEFSPDIANFKKNISSLTQKEKSKLPEKAQRILEKAQRNEKRGGTVSFEKEVKEANPFAPGMFTTKKVPVNEKINETISINEPLSFREAHDLKVALNEIGSKFKNSALASEQQLANKYFSLSRSLKEDMISSADKKGFKQIKEGYEKAEDFYAINKKPFHEKPIANFIEGNPDADKLISEFIKTSKSGSKDYANHLKVILDRIPKEKQKVLGHAYLTNSINSDGRIIPEELNKLKSAVGEKTFKLLFSDPKDQKILREFGEFHEMSLPGKGNKNMSWQQSVIENAKKLGPGLIGATVGGAIGGPLGSAVGSVVTAGGSAALARQLLKYSTNPKYREQLINTLKNIEKQKAMKEKK